MIIFDLALHICVFIIHAEYFWLVIAGLKKKFYTLIPKFVYITFCFTNGTTDYVAAEDLDDLDLILLQSFF